MRFLRFGLIVIFAFILGARIANADCRDNKLDVYLEPAYLVGHVTGHGSTQDPRIAGGVTVTRCSDRRVTWAMRLGGVFEVTLADDVRYGAGGEFEVDKRLGGRGVGVRIGATFGPDNYMLLLVGARYREGPFWFGVDAGRYATNTNDDDGGYPRVRGVIVVGGMGINTGRTGVIVGVVVGLIAAATITPSP